jgi:hypothetical protein
MGDIHQRGADQRSEREFLVGGLKASDYNSLNLTGIEEEAEGRGLQRKPEGYI